MWRLSLALMLVAVLTGCGPVSEMFGSTSYTGRAKDDYGYGTASELQPLLARRDLEEVLAERDRMIVAIIASVAYHWTTGPLKPYPWLAAKLLIFAFLIFCGFMIRVTFPPFMVGWKTLVTTARSPRRRALCAPKRW